MPFAQLATICREHLLREKILIVPSLAIGHQIADAIAHGGTSWVNLRTETIRTLSDAVAGFRLASEGVTVLSRAQALALIERACDRVLDSSSYFAALADRPGLHRAIQKSIDDLRHGGVDPSRLRTSTLEDARKAADLARILEAYEDEMRRGKYIDRFGVLARAVEMLESGATPPWAKDALWLIVDEVELTSFEERFLNSASPRETIHADDGEKPVIAFRRAIGEENEIRGAFRSLLGQKIPFDDAEVVYTARDPYLTLACELAAEYDVPCTFAEGIPSHFTRPGQACLAFLRWAGEGWRAVHLQAAARAGAIATPSFARILRRARIGWGRERYLDRIDILIADPELGDGIREKAVETRALVAELIEMTAAVAAGDRISLGALARAAAAFVARFALIRNDADAMAREGLKRMLNELAAVESSDSAPPRGEVAARLAEAVRNLHVAASNPRPGFLHFAPARSGGWSARSHLFVVGLDEARHPGSGLQDPILLDSERQSIGIPIVGDRPQRVAEQFRRLMRRASSRQITLFYTFTILGDRSERFPSPALLEIFRSASGKKDATYEEAEAAIAREGFIDPTPLVPAEWWLLRRLADGATDLASSIRMVYPHLDAGMAAEEARDLMIITPYDGLIRVPREEIDPRLTGRPYSASQLETMASCPYRYFLQRVLKVQPVDEIDYEPDTWLQANEFGSMMHEVLQRGMTDLRARGERMSADFLPRLREIAEEALEAWRKNVPPPSDSAFRRRRDELLESCDTLLRMESEVSATPKHFETSFGFDESDGLAIPGPVAIALGNAEVRIRGRIDRIDHDEESGEWHVWDYKSGGTWDFDKGGRLRAGTKMQHALYARALRAMLEQHRLSGSVTRSGYLFPTRKGRGARIERECSDAELRETLNLLFDVIGSGFFPHAEEDACRFCDYQVVCGGAKRAGERMRAKLLANRDDAAVAAWLALQEVK